MNPFKGIDDDKMIHVDVYDTSIFGSEAQDELASILYELSNLATLPFAELAQHENLISFTTQLNALLSVISSHGATNDFSETSNLPSYYEAIQRFDIAKDSDDQLYFAELNDLRDIARRLLKNFLLNAVDREPQPKPEPEVSKPKLKIVEMLARLMSGLRPHDK
jgi:hypothetical protein